MANSVPTLTGLDTPVTFLENTVNAAPQIIDGNVAFADANGDFSGGTLTVSNLLAEDTRLHPQPGHRRRPDRLFGRHRHL